MPYQVSLRQRVQQLVTDIPEELVNEETERLLNYHSDRTLSDEMRLSDAAFIVASMVLAKMHGKPTVHTIVLDDGVKTSDG